MKQTQQGSHSTNPRSRAYRLRAPDTHVMKGSIYSLSGTATGQNSADSALGAGILAVQRLFPEP